MSLNIRIGEYDRKILLVYGLTFIMPRNKEVIDRLVAGKCVNTTNSSFLNCVVKAARSYAPREVLLKRGSGPDQCSDISTIVYSSKLTLIDKKCS